MVVSPSAMTIAVRVEPNIPIPRAANNRATFFRRFILFTSLGKWTNVDLSCDCSHDMFNRAIMVVTRTDTETDTTTSLNRRADDHFPVSQTALYAAYEALPCTKRHRSASGSSSIVEPSILPRKS